MSDTKGLEKLLGFAKLKQIQTIPTILRFCPGFPIFGQIWYE